MDFGMKSVYSVGNDRNIWKVNYFEEQEPEPKPIDVSLSALAIPSSDKLLFGGIHDEKLMSGAIRCLNLPLFHKKFQDYIGHDERGVEKMRITNDDKYLITAGRDGCVLVYEIKDKDARDGKYKEGYSKPSDEILVTR